MLLQKGPDFHFDHVRRPGFFFYSGFFNFKVFYTCTLIFAPNFGMGMTSRLMKSFTVAVFSIFSLLISAPGFAKYGDGENGDHKKKSFDAQKVIFGHILDGHEFHFFDIINDDGSHTPVGIPLPVLLYSPQKGFDVFMS